MKLHTQSWLLLVLSVLLISASARPYGIAPEHAGAETTEVSERDGFSLFGISILPRFPLRLGGFKSSSKPKPKPAEGKPPKEKPSPAKESPAPAKSDPANAKSAEAPKKSDPAPAKSSHAADTKPTSSKASKAPASSTASSSVSPSGTDQPRKCLTNTCGGKGCTLKRDDEESTAPADVEKRAFGTFKTEKDVAKLQKASGTVDLSTFAKRDGSFTPFGTKPLAAAVTGLEGCAMVAAFSDQGMQVSHLFEQSQDIDELKQTLHPQFFKDTVAAVGARFTANKAKFQGGQAVVMLPMDPADTTQFKYESEVSTAFNTKTNKLDNRLKKVTGKGTVEAIIDMVKASTGLEPQVIKYTPPKTDAEAAQLEKSSSIRGTFVAQYDPANAPGQAAVQIFGEGNPALSPSPSFKTPA